MYFQGNSVVPGKTTQKLTMMNTNQCSFSPCLFSISYCHWYHVKLSEEYRKKNGPNLISDCCKLHKGRNCVGLISLVLRIILGT